LGWTSGVRFRYSRLKEAALFAARRYGISIDFSLEVIEKKSISEVAFKSKFIDLTMQP
jgi:hypothetical protein